MADGYGRIFGYNPITYTPTVTPAEATGYLVANVADYDNLDRTWRSTSTAQQTITLTFSGSKTVKTLIFDHCNFTSVTIAGISYTLTRDPKTWRYRLNLVRTITGSSITIVVPSQTPTNGVAYFFVGRIIVMDSYVEFTLNENSLSEKAPYPEPIRNTFPDGHVEDVITGDLKKYEKRFSFERNNKTNVDAELWLLDSLKPTDYIHYFANEGDSSQGWLCKKESSLEIDEHGEDNPDILGVSEHHIVEVI
jgi:hypothetical protein